VPVVSLDSVSLAFGHLPLLENVVLQVEPGERVAIVGRNGTGKSTLLRVMSGEQAPDSGTVWKQPGLQVARLDQDVPLSTERSVFEVVAGGLGELSDLVARYHRSALAVAEHESPERLEELGRLQHALEERDGWTIEQRVETILARLSLPSDTPVETLSGGWKRRVLLARALVGSPGLLLLDEPTNHLDIGAIAWLESFLTESAAATVFVTHDRTFLQHVATRIVEIDRGRVTSWPGDYETFLRRRDERLAAEETARDKFDKRMAVEEAWLRRGVKARRTRDEGRVRALLAMREERRARRERTGAVRLSIDQAGASGKVVLDAEDVSKSYGGRAVVSHFSTRILRGDRVGVIGANGSGKTTLLRLLLGELEPDQGEVRRGTGVQVAYYDQQREQLDPDRTVFDTVGDGNDVVSVDGRSRHVNAYLSDFLFPKERAQSPVRSLSGGERNRLLLARLFTRPANLLVLDEPTNDLDLETLELLEAQLADWPGTLILVTHDRAFLDNIVTSTLVCEGDGRVGEYVGGYDDAMRQRAAMQPPDVEEKQRPHVEAASRAAGRRARETGGKLSYNEQRELDALPARIEALETERAAVAAAIAHPDFYRESKAAIASALERADAIERELSELYARWDALDSRSA
jgi:ATP-binding cassette subfamily F protein uup